MAIANNPKKLGQFSLAEDATTAESERSVFLLRVLTWAQRSELLRLYMAAHERSEQDIRKAQERGSGEVDHAEALSPDAQLLMLNTYVEAARAGLAGWRKVRDEDGQDVPFATEKGVCLGIQCEHASEQSLAALDIVAIRQIGEEVFHRCRLSQNDRKNS